MDYRPYKSVRRVVNALKTAKTRNSTLERVALRETENIDVICALDNYFQAHVNSQWKEYEDWLLKVESFNYMKANYAMKILERRWIEAEAQMLKPQAIGFCMIDYTKKFFDGRWPELEKAMLSNAENTSYYMIRYAEVVIKGRWPEAEVYFSSNYQHFHQYVQTVLKARWNNPKAEKSLIDIPDHDRIDELGLIGQMRFNIKEYLEPYCKEFGITRHDVTLSVLSEYPEMIRFLPESSPQEQIQAVKFGGREVFLMIKTPHDEVKKMFPELDGLRKSGLFR